MYIKIKDILDRIFAFISIAVFSPLIIATVIAVRSDRNGKAFFRQDRVGKDGRIFKIYKFRTMKSTDIAFDPDHAVIEDDDPHVTKVGRVLRKFKIDELPQLFNILKGDMSFIGPRPLMAVYLEEYEDWEKQKFAVKPGLSCYSQVNGNGYLKTRARSYYDVLYTERISFPLDVKLFFATFAVILKGEERFLKDVPDEKIDEMAAKYSNSAAADKDSEI